MLSFQMLFCETCFKIVINCVIKKKKYKHRFIDLENKQVVAPREGGREISKRGKGD